MDAAGFYRPNMLRQNFPSPPTFTEKNLKDLSSKVYFITGANAGVGRELTRILYAAHATIYMACRSESKARQAMKEIQQAEPDSKGHLELIIVDLGNLMTIKPAVETFLSKESKLNVLFNNAGIMIPPDGKKTAQGYDLQLGTNCVGPFLLTQLLTPLLIQTAKTEPAGAVRVVWVSSMAADLYAPHNGVDMSNIRGKDFINPGPAMQRYGLSKAGNYLHGVEYSRRYKNQGILSVVCNPGNLQSNLYDNVEHQPLFKRIALNTFNKLMLHPVVFGAYTELFAGLSPEVTIARAEEWIGPWGRFFRLRSDIVKAAKPISHGGQDNAKKFWEWSEEQVKQYA